MNREALVKQAAESLGVDEVMAEQLINGILKERSRDDFEVIGLIAAFMLANAAGQKQAV